MAKVYMGTTEMTPAILKVVGTAEGVVLPDQAGNAGKFLHTDGENLSWENAIKNNADVSQALAVGHDTRAESFASTSIGAGAVAESEYGVAMGYGAWVTSDMSDGKNILTRYSTALGYSATVTKPNSVALVSDGGVYASQGVAIGYGASTRTADSISIGNSASTGTDTPSEDIAGAIAIGKNAKAKVAYSIAIGNNANANADNNTEGQMEQNSIAIGDNVTSTAEKAISLGTATSAQAKSALAVGTNAVAVGPDSIVIGTNAKSNSPQGANVVIGPDSKVNGYSFNSTAVGIGAQAQNYDATAIGRNAVAGAQYSFAAGYSAQTNPAYCDDSIDFSQPVVAVGFEAISRSNDTIAIGRSVYADGPFSIVIGQNSNVDNSNDYGIAIGKEVQVVGSEGIAVGHSSVSARHGIALGTRANANNFGTVSIGLNSESTSTNAVAIGNQSYARGQDSVALGSSAIVDEGAGFAVQLGVGTNYDANTLQFKDYKLLYENGVIPYSRFTDINSPSNGQTLVYDENEDMLVWSDAAGGISEVNWGDITGNISDQEDLNDKFDDIRNNFQNINEDIQSLDLDMSTNYRNLDNKFDEAIQNLEQDFSTSTRRLESDIQDAEDRLQTQIDTLSSIGQFLAIWDCDTGIARYLNEGFEYQTGNYFIIGTIAEGEGAVNYMPDGNMYPGKVATTEDVRVSDMWFYDGAHWIYLANHERAIAVDAALDSTSSNPVENKAITKHLGEFELLLDGRFDDIRNSIDETNSYVEELENRPIPIAVPQLASVDVLQIKTQAEKAARLPKEEWMGEYSDIIVTLNLTKEQILERMYDLYVTVSRFKTNKNLTYTEYSEDGEQDINYRNISKFSVMNDLRQKTNERLYCWRFVTDSSYNETDPRRYCYFYTKDNFNDNVDALWEEDPGIGLWSGYGSSAGIGTCFNSIVWYEHGYHVQMFYDDYFDGSSSIERYEEGDIDSFANLSNSSHYPEYNISNYVTKIECRKYTKDGQNYFFWAEKDKWDNGGSGYCVGDYLAPIPNGIPKYMETLVNAFDEVRQIEENGFVFVEKRPDLNYKRVEDFEALLEALQALTFRGKYVDNDGYPTYWNCYWFDYPVMPVLLKDCEVRIQTNATKEDYSVSVNTGEWYTLEYLSNNGLLSALRDDLSLELKLPYNTYYLWMRFCSLQKRCAYGNYSNWMQEDGREIDRPMWPDQKHNLREGVQDYNVLNRRAFARPRQGYKGSDYSKVSEYILFNVCSPLDAASGSKSKSTPIQKKLNIDHHAKTGLRD